MLGQYKNKLRQCCMHKLIVLAGLQVHRIEMAVQYQNKLRRSPPHKLIVLPGL